MGRFSKLLRRLEGNQHLVLDAVRFYLGAGLFFRGLVFLFTGVGPEELAGSAAPSLATSGVALYVTTAHLVGGALLAVGLYTRLAALAQWPVLGGAMIMVHWQNGLLSANQSLEFSALVFFLLTLVIVFGGGRWSFDAQLNAGIGNAVQAPGRRR